MEEYYMKSKKAPMENLGPEQDIRMKLNCPQQKLKSS